MKKLIIALGVLVVLAIGSVTAVLLVNNDQKKKNDENAKTSADYVLFNFDPDAVNHMDFSCEDGDFSVEKDENNAWNLIGDDVFGVKTTYVQGVYTTMSDLVAEKDYGEITDESKEMYGLDNPTVITVSDGNRSNTLYIGDADPTNTYFYVMTDSKSKIYAIDYSTGESYKTTRLMLKDAYLTKYDIHDIAEIKLVRDGETAFDMTYNKEDTVWELPAEYSGFEADQSTISTMIAYLIRIEAQEFYDEDLQDLSKYGFDKPYAELILKGFDGKTHKYLFSYFGNNTTTYTHVLFEESGQVAAFYSGDVDFIRRSQKDYVVNKVFPYSVFDTGELGYFYGDTEAHIDNIQADDQSFDFRLGDKTIVKGVKFTGEFNDFYASVENIGIAEIDLEAKPVPAEPFMSFQFYDKKAKKFVLFELTEADDSLAYVFRDGEFTGILVKKSDLIGMKAVSGYFDTLLDLLD